MTNNKKRDYQTISLFIILGILTLVLVLGFRMVLFAPSFTQPVESVEAIRK